jgi:hypothetical protein
MGAGAALGGDAVGRREAAPRDGAAAVPRARLRHPGRVHLRRVGRRRGGTPVSCFLRLTCCHACSGEACCRHVKACASNSISNTNSALKAVQTICTSNLHSCWTAPATDNPVIPCQAALYQACIDAGITLLSIGHRPAIKAFHQAVIHFQVRGSLSASTVVMLQRVRVPSSDPYHKIGLIESDCGLEAWSSSSAGWPARQRQRLDARGAGSRVRAGKPAGKRQPQQVTMHPAAS